MIRVACIGECMIELAHLEPKTLQLGFGGDTLNTAAYLARMTGRDAVAVDYVTALGDDAYSEAMLEGWRAEGIGVALVERRAGRLPGLYTIRTDADGERHFTYWRDRAPAREMLAGARAGKLLAALESHDLLYASGITLSILDQPQRAALERIAARIRAAGGRVAFDGNFRPAGWPDPAEARAAYERLLGHADIALPTLEDETALFDSKDAPAVAARLHRLGVAEVVVKLGAKGCYLSSAAFTGVVEAAPVAEVVDSTAAGDSFNAGYLAARLRGEAPPSAAGQGHALASRVIGHRGAVIPKSAMADLMP
jgi:2-dehydro-3-deoxygluconokinase